MADHFSPLQSICYEHGALRLLDQRKLPLEIVYLDIKNATDGWRTSTARIRTGNHYFRDRRSSTTTGAQALTGRSNPMERTSTTPGHHLPYLLTMNAIRDMVVRGAPAIAISAALSLAVEVFHLDFNGTSSDAASFLFDKLEYLVSSRPTAVNLSDAATKLRNVALKAAETATEAKIVFQTYIDAAEHMLIDDVNSNKAIGFNGAIGIQAKLNDSKRISVLTHCNTGSLATAGYGTALGVIRALNTRGILEMAFCTETRPFNQGSRLTAFELVHDKIPATLIADSAAASLMKAGRVSAVIVGADRIAANGDTANKIGTYSLALSAFHHGVPFYVAAPVTSIDLSLASGDQIVIEERSPKELLCSDGGLGKQIAAPGIDVWNPAFDVTPANLITAIVTEKGVITKILADDFDIKGFIEKSAGREEEEESSAIMQ